jgi:hypothetical protein
MPVAALHVGLGRICNQDYFKPCLVNSDAHRLVFRAYGTLNLSNYNGVSGNHDLLVLAQRETRSQPYSKGMTSHYKASVVVQCLLFRNEGPAVAMA